MTPKELFLAVKNKEEYDGFAIKSIIRPLCETIRMEAYWLVNLQLDKKHKIKDPRKVMLFEWDKRVKEGQSREQMLSVMRTIIADTKGKKPKTPTT